MVWQELRDYDDGHSSSGAYVSEEEGVSHGEGSDREAGTSPKAPLPEFVAPDDELKDRIIKQVTNLFF